jgi:hypothetical protein
MACQPGRSQRLRTICRRVAPAAVTLIASAAVVAPASAAGPTIVVSGDSVVGSSLSAFGQATIQATRPDALTGKPVVIGQYTGSANPFTPFSANTVTPSPLAPAGDCWQKGALSQALTPDLQPGDTVNISQAPLFGGTATSTSVVVQSGDLNATLGPIAGCSSIAPWAHNAITTAPGKITGGPLTVSGVAQPLATEVTVSATDGSHTSAPVTATPAADGTWTATIPADQVSALASTSLSVTPVVSVPDVSTGTQADIAGVGVTVEKTGPDGTPTSGTTGGPGTQPPSATSAGSGAGHSGRPTKLSVSGLRLTGMSLVDARRRGILVSFRVPAGTRIVRVVLLRGKKRVVSTTVHKRGAAGRQTVVLRSSGLSTGSYTVAIRIGASRSSLGPTTMRNVRIH